MLWRRRVLPIRSLDSKAGSLAGGDGACADPRRSARAHLKPPVGCLVTAIASPVSSSAGEAGFGPHLVLAKQCRSVCSTASWDGQAPPAPNPLAASKPHCPPVRASGVGRPVGSPPRRPPSPGPILPGSAATSTGPCARAPCTHSILSRRWARSPQFLSCLLNAPREPSRVP